MRAVLLALNWQFVSLEEDALGDASVLNTGFDDVNRVVFEVEIENALADAEIFGRIFNDWFLEVAFKIQHLAIVLQPLGSNFWDSIVLLNGTLLHSASSLRD